MCGIFKFSSRGEIFSTSPAIQLKPSVVTCSLPRGRHQLHADADAEERPRLASHRFGHRLDHAVKRIEAAAAIGEVRRRRAARCDRRDTPLRDRGSPRSFPDRSMLRARALERFRGGVQIAGAVIDDGNAHRDAPGSGNNPMMLALAAAAAASRTPGREYRRVGGGAPRSTAA